MKRIESHPALAARRQIDRGIETSGLQMPQSARKLHYARLVAAHDARDMTDYRSAVKAYEEAAREAYRRAKKEAKREEG